MKKRSPLFAPPSWGRNLSEASKYNDSRSSKSNAKRKKATMMRKKYKGRSLWGSLALFAGGAIAGVVVYRLLTRGESVQPAPQASVAPSGPNASVAASPIVATPVNTQGRVAATPAVHSAASDESVVQRNTAGQALHGAVAVSPGGAPPVHSSPSPAARIDSARNQPQRPLVPPAQTSSSSSTIPVPTLPLEPRSMGTALINLAVGAAELCQLSGGRSPKTKGRDCLRGDRGRRGLMASRWGTPPLAQNTPPPSAQASRDTSSTPQHAPSVKQG